MANYYGTSRTNYFKVKDPALFRAWADKFDLKIIEDNGLFGLLPGDTDEGTFSLYDEENDDQLDICDEIARHLAEDTVAVIVEAGHEKLRYVSGWAVAINHAAERVELSLDDIYQLATSKFGIAPTEAAN